MTYRVKTLQPLLASVAVVLVGSTLVWRATLGFQAFTWESYRRHYVLQHPIHTPDVQLQDQDGKLFTPSVYQSKLVLVNFVYTRCPSLCTYSGTIYGRILKALAEDKHADQVRLLSISLDPDYDTPAHLREYRSRYTRDNNTVWRVARPMPIKDGKKLLALFGVISIPDGLGGIKHNAAVHVIDRQGRLVRIISESNYDKILRTVDEQLDTK